VCARMCVCACARVCLRVCACVLARVRDDDTARVCLRVTVSLPLALPPPFTRPTLPPL
jgi:hypothetical protein